MCVSTNDLLCLNGLTTPVFSTVTLVLHTSCVCLTVALLVQESCSYFTRSNQRLRYQDQMPLEGLGEAWPLEELVALGRRIRACPYYGARNLKEEADIVFCPYNYLIEPGIRESVRLWVGTEERELMDHQ